MLMKSQVPPASCTCPCILAVQNYMVLGIVSLCSWDRSEYLSVFSPSVSEICHGLFAFFIPDLKNVFGLQNAGLQCLEC